MGKLEEIVRQFCIRGDVESIQCFGCGHINSTYRVRCRDGAAHIHYTLQKINTQVFHNPHQLMANVQGVTAHLRSKILEEGGDPDRETLSVVPARDGSVLYQQDGETWRVYTFIEGAVSFESAEEHPEVFYNAARSFGQFQKRLADYPAQTLYETIPDFHNTAKRFRDFQQAVQEDVCGRAREVVPEIDLIRAREADCAVVVDLIRQGKLPLRVTHNDTKLNNILMDPVTYEGVCVIDLDTVMPGSALYDFGDSIRFGASSASEDEQDLSKVYLDLNLFQKYTDGYLSQAAGSLTDLEKELLPFSAKLLTLECGMRFLTDYLQGDTYFKIHRPGHNLDRARTQLKLVTDMEQKMAQMQGIVRNCLRQQA